ncbi:tyrosine-type recombinase/integrase [Demequina aurantiaca]|uniref:tyrosine-type recombinase/integrase n=1 Tax=Demequina aurantiaca TaxID=676200 RepID=UPI003D353F9A
METLTARDIETWVKAMHSQGLAPTTIRTRVAIIRAVLTSAVRDGYIPSNPCTGVRLPRISRRATSVALPNETAIARLIATSEPTFAVLFALAAYAGLRLGEARALTWGDADLNAGRLTIGKQLQQVPGGGWTESPPKYGSFRTVPICAELKAILLPEEREEGRLVVEGREGGPVHPGSVQRTWREQRELCGLPPTFRLHDLRHWYVSRLIGKGTDILTIQRRIGHARASTTLDVYAHVWPTQVA